MLPTLFPWVAAFIILRRDLAHIYKLEAGELWFAHSAKPLCVPSGHKYCGEQRHGPHTQEWHSQETESPEGLRSFTLWSEERKVSSHR